MNSLSADSSSITHMMNHYNPTSSNFLFDPNGSVISAKAMYYDTTTNVHEYIEEYFNNGVVRTYTETNEFFQNVKMDLYDKIQKALNEKNVSDVMKYSRTLNDFENVDSNILYDTKTAKKVNEDCYLITINFVNIYVQIQLNKKEYANLKIRS